MKEKGFTIIELMVVLAILGTLTAMAVPGVSSYMDKKRLINAAEAVYGQLQYARSEAISRSADMFVTFDVMDSTTWALGMSTVSGCDADATDGVVTTCVLVLDDGDGVLDDGSGTVDAGDALIRRGLSSTDFPGITLGGSTAGTNVSFFGTGHQVRFDYVRGTASNGSIYLALGSQYEMRLVVSPIGRIKMCSPSGSTNVPGYSTC